MHAFESISGTFARQIEVQTDHISRLIVQIGNDVTVGRSTLLTESVFSIVEFLSHAEVLDPNGAAVIDIRMPPLEDVRLAAEAESFVSAAQGLLQSWVLERGSSSCTANLIVSGERQDAEVELAFEYFTGELGGFSRGSTLDLREGTS